MGDKPRKPRNPRPPGYVDDLEEFYAQVQQAAAEDQKKKRYKRSPAQQAVSEKMRAARKRVGNPRLNEIRRHCDAINSKGDPCRAPAMRGATRCQAHGGRRQNPAHPSNIARLLDGRMGQWVEGDRVKRVWSEAEPEAQRAVIAAEAQSPHYHCRAIRQVNRAKGIEAHRAAKRGDPTQWTQWIRLQPDVMRKYQQQLERNSANELFRGKE